MTAPALIALAHGSPVLLSPALARCVGAPSTMVAAMEPAALARQLDGLAEDRPALEENARWSAVLRAEREWPAVASRHLDVYGDPGFGAQVQGGKVRLLATFTEQRLAKYNAPTVKELGWDFVIQSPVGLVAPKGMDAAIAARLHAAFRKAAADPAYLQQVELFDMQPGLMTGEAYAQSARVARDHGGPFGGYAKNREPFLRVMRKHRDAIKGINARNVPPDLYNGARQAWDEAVELGVDFGYRNAQATVLAPTGTIGFMMDCDTTGVEPDIALVKYKKLVGGGMIKIVNQSVPQVLRKLGYSPLETDDIVRYIDDREMIEGAPHLRDEHLPIFDCAFPARDGKRSIHWMGHIKMMAAVQPFLSGAISKTVNMPNDATPEDIQEAYVEGWRLGLKAIAVYRDGCKRSQPLSTSKEEAKVVAESKAKEAAAEPASTVGGRPARRKLPDERLAITHKFSIAGHEGYITVGMYEDGKPGEIFLVMAKEGSTISGLMDAFATSISLALQYGVPLKALVDKFSHMRFEPSGFTKNPEIPIAKSITDYIFRWLASKFLTSEEKQAVGVILRDAEAPSAEPAAAAGRTDGTGVRYTVDVGADAPSCHECGAIMVRNGSCYKCNNCGSTSGCS